MGVCHHSNYLRILEDARIEWLDRNVMQYRDMEKMGIIIPAVKAAGEFKSFLRFGDKFKVFVHLVGYNGVRLCFSYEIYKSDTDILCYIGETEHYFAEETGYKPMTIKRKYPQLHEKFLALTEESIAKETPNKVNKLPF